jgi:glycosyltransferase involved in cell wall biosynthesis
MLVVRPVDRDTPNAAARNGVLTTRGVVAPARSDRTHYSPGVPDKPSVVIGLPVYNGEQFLEQAIDSILQQTYVDFQLLVSDNASTDRTAEILADYAARDARVTVVTAEQNMGAGWNFTRVLELAGSPTFFKWQAHDDVLEPTFLERCVERLTANPEASLAFSGVDVVDEDGKFVEDYDIELDTGHPDPVVRFAELLLKWQMCFEVFGVIRMAHLRQTAGMGNYSHGDGVLLGHLGLLGPIERVPEVLFHSRKHPGQSMQQFGQASGGNDYYAYLLWFDPTRKGKLVLPNWKIIREYQRTISATPMKLRQRARCEWVLVRRMRWDARHLLRDLRHAVRFFVARARGRRSAAGT